MISNITAFLVMLNPFALFLYLTPIMKDLEHKDFLKVLWKATLISFAVFAIFLWSGDFLLQKVFQISMDSFRIFGGVIIFSFAYLFIVKGQKAFIYMKGSLDDLASEIALPFMVGAGTISLSILISHEFPLSKGLICIGLIMIINFFVIMALKSFRDLIVKKKLKIAFDKNMQILLRINGFFIGAIGVSMVVKGIKGLIG